MRGSHPDDDTFDAVIVGDGLNGSVAAAELAGHGWSVALVPDHEEAPPASLLGTTAPGFVHDTPTLWHALFRAGPSWAELGADLERFGLRYLVADGPATAVVGDRGAVLGHRSAALTAAEMPDRLQEAAYVASMRRASELAPRLVAAQGAGLHPGELLTGGPDQPPPTDLRVPGCPRDGDAARLWAPWAARAGLTSPHPRVHLLLPTLALTLGQVGMPVVRGGADCFEAALEALLDDRGVTRVTGGPAERIEVANGRAVAVHVGGRRLEAIGSVLAATDVARLQQELLPEGSAPTVGPGRGTSPPPRPGRPASAQLHLALARPLAWTDHRLDEVPLVHVERAGEPAVAVGQPSVVDPTRAPLGAATLWLSVDLPEGSGGDPLAVDRATDSALAAVARHAPGLRASIVGCHVDVTPEVPPTDPRLVADLRPLPAWHPGAGSAHATSVAGLFHVGAYTLPRACSEVAGRLQSGA